MVKKILIVLLSVFLLMLNAHAGSDGELKLKKQLRFYYQKQPVMQKSIEVSEMHAGIEYLHQLMALIKTFLHFIDQ